MEESETGEGWEKGGSGAARELNGWDCFGLFNILLALHA